jgi:hypothetical protein
LFSWQQTPATAPIVVSPPPRFKQPPTKAKQAPVATNGWTTVLPRYEKDTVTVVGRRMPRDIGFVTLVVTGNSISENKRAYTNHLADDVNNGRGALCDRFQSTYEQIGPDKGPIHVGKPSSENYSRIFYRITPQHLTDQEIETELDEFANVFRTDMRDAKKGDGAPLYYYNNKVILNIGLMKEGPEPMALYNHFILNDVAKILRTKWAPETFDEIINDGYLETYLNVVFGELGNKNRDFYINLLQTHWEPQFTIPHP